MRQGQGDPGGLIEKVHSEQATKRELAEIRRRERRARLEEALRDPLFLRDLADVERDFAFADAEIVTESLI